MQTNPNANQTPSRYLYMPAVNISNPHYKRKTPLNNITKPQPPCKKMKRKKLNGHDSSLNWHET